MASIAIIEPSTSQELVRAKVLLCGVGVRYQCVKCDSYGFMQTEEDEQRELVILKSDIEKIRDENFKLSKLINDENEKVKSMNDEMDNFFNQHSLGNKVGKEDKAIQAECFAVDTRVDQNQEEMKVWKNKEETLKNRIEKQKRILSLSQTIQKQPAVPSKLWGHQTITWTPWGRRGCRRQTTASKKLSNKKLPVKPYSIPFQPRPFDLYIKKSSIKPPPRLPQLSYTQQIRVLLAKPPVSAVRCDSVQCDQDLPEEADNVLREIFANALERAVNSNNEENLTYDPFFDHEEDLSDNEENLTYDPFFDHEEDLSDNVDYVDTHEVTEDDHKLANDCEEELDEYANDHFVDEEVSDDAHEPSDVCHLELDEYANEHLVDEEISETTVEGSYDAFDDDSSATDVAWEETPYYSTDDDQQDLAWEESPYY